MKNKPVILALDFPNWHKADQFLNENELKGVPVKVGMELFYREGPKVIERLKANNHFVFLDLKLHDIPNTVESAMRNLASLGVDMVNVHAAGGSKMIAAARNGLEKGTPFSSKRAKLLAVTQLTSTDSEMLIDELAIHLTLDKAVNQYANVAKKGGADGVVCSVHEVNAIKQECGQDFYTCTPGIRFTEDASDDQVRVATPMKASLVGADSIVMGRSITRANDPREQYVRALKEWEHGK